MEEAGFAIDENIVNIRVFLYYNRIYTNIEFIELCVIIAWNSSQMAETVSTKIKPNTITLLGLSLVSIPCYSKIGHFLNVAGMLEIV